MGREDDDVKVDNVICRTPARNAQNLDAVKNEILEMVDRAVSFTMPLRFRISNVYGRIPSILLRSSMSTVSITVSFLLVFRRLMSSSRSTTARSTSPALSKLVMR